MYRIEVSTFLLVASIILLNIVRAYYLRCSRRNEKEKKELLKWQQELEQLASSKRKH